jgi:hypothetical protein
MRWLLRLVLYEFATTAGPLVAQALYKEWREYRKAQRKASRVGSGRRRRAAARRSFRSTTSGKMPSARK